MVNRPISRPINRRWVLTGVAGIAVIAGLRALRGPEAAAAAGTFEIEKFDAEWHKLLTPAQYDVLREHGTEPPFSSPLDHEKRKGTFACAACDLPLYSSETKFDSGTGWPSFYQPLANAIGTTTDRSFLMVRTEVHCRRCGGHLGHVFKDGPPPTGLRYCMNGLSLKFTPAPAAPPA
ncbi:MAG TPA: peptide-methionine (R)-S-oxide reductase MsrB [Xanthobacteraceae bacterium]